MMKKEPLMVGPMKIPMSRDYLTLAKTTEFNMLVVKRIDRVFAVTAAVWIMGVLPNVTAADAIRTSSWVGHQVMPASGPAAVDPYPVRLAAAADDAGDDRSIAEMFDEMVGSVDERFESVDERFEEMDERLVPLEDFADDDTIVISGTSKSTMKVVGRVHADMWGFPNVSQPAGVFDDFNPQDRIGFRRMRFGVRGKIKDNMVYRIEMEFAGGNNSEFRDAFLGFTDLPVLRTVLIGNQKRPYGLDHLNSSRYNVFLERPFVIESFNQDARRWGICSYGVSDDQRFNWRYGVYNQQLIQALGNYVGDHWQMEVAGRLANTIWYDEVSGGRGYAHWAISGTVAEPSDDNPGNTDTEARFRHRPEARSSERWLDTGDIAGADFYELMGLEGVINVGRVQFVGEWQNTWLQREVGAPSDNVRFWGSYFYVSYFLTGEHMPWDRKTGTLARIKPFQNFWLVDCCRGGRAGGWGAWQVAARYSYADFNSDDIFGGVGESFTFGLNWYWNQNARMQFNCIYGSIRDRDDAEVAGVTLESTDYTILGGRFMVDF